MPAYFHRATCIHHPSCYPHYARLFQDVVESENSQSEFYPFFFLKYVVVSFASFTSNFLVVCTWYGWKRTRGRVLHANVLHVSSVRRLAFMGYTGCPQPYRLPRQSAMLHLVCTNIIVKYAPTHQSHIHHLKRRRGYCCAFCGNFLTYLLPAERKVVGV